MSVSIIAALRSSGMRSRFFPSSAEQNDLLLLLWLRALSPRSHPHHHTHFSSSYPTASLVLPQTCSMQRVGCKRMVPGLSGGVVDGRWLHCQRRPAFVLLPRSRHDIRTERPKRGEREAEQRRRQTRDGAGGRRRSKEGEREEGMVRRKGEEGGRERERQAGRQEGKRERSPADRKHAQDWRACGRRGKARSWSSSGQNGSGMLLSQYSISSTDLLSHTTTCCDCPIATSGVSRRADPPQCPVPSCRRLVLAYVVSLPTLGTELGHLTNRDEAPLLLSEPAPPAPLPETTAGLPPFMLRAAIASVYVASIFAHTASKNAKNRLRFG